MVLSFISMQDPQSRVAKGRPLLNDIPIGRSSSNNMSGSNTVRKKIEFWNWFKTKPELNSPVSARVDDTIVDVDFFKPNGEPLGRNKVIESKKFWQDNFMNERLKSIWFDAIVTGSGFGWIGKLDFKKLKEVTDKFASIINIKSLDTNELKNSLYLRAIDEDIRKTRTFDYVASSTMIIEHNYRDILRYVQRSNGIQEDFNPKEIIHFKFSSLDGKVDGWSPVESLSREIILLWFIKENMVSYARNGGLPRKIFNLPEEIANTDNHNYLIDLLKNYNAVENRNGNLVLTGKVDVLDLDEKLRDMEYKELALYVTSNIAYALRVPVSRIPYMIGSSQSNGDAGGMAESGYWSMIKSDQVRIEHLLNTQLLNEMGFMVRFKKRYLIDDLRETQAMTMRADAIQKMNVIWSQRGKELTDTKMIELMDLKVNDVQKLENTQPLLQNNMMQSAPVQLGNNALDNPDKQQKNDTKSNAAVNNPKGHDQTGV